MQKLEPLAATFVLSTLGNFEAMVVQPDSGRILLSGQMPRTLIRSGNVSFLMCIGAIGVQANLSGLH